MFATTIAALDTVRQASLERFSVEQIRAAEALEWELNDDTIEHRTRGFFSVVGVDPGDSPPHVLLYQPQAAVTGLLTTVHQGETYALLQARAEPGCVGGVQFGPTIQSTPANFLSLHGGAPPPYAAAFLTAQTGVSLLSDTTQSDLGGRYLMKSKRAVLASCGPSVPVAPGFVWASMDLLRQAVARSTFLNIDLRSLLSMLPWGEQGRPALIAPTLAAARRSLQAPVRPDVVGRLHCRTSSNAVSRRLIPLRSVPGWTLSEWGLKEHIPAQGFEVNFYRIEAHLREVSHWSQPLVACAAEGRCELACRERDGMLEVLVRSLRETGLALGWGLAPTVVCYPGNAGPPMGALDLLPGHELLATVESDEGGRFFQHSSRYSLVFLDPSADDPAAKDPDLTWLTLADVKACLSTSNLCTIQLRGLLSHLLAL